MLRAEEDLNWAIGQFGTALVRVYGATYKALVSTPQQPIEHAALLVDVVPVSTHRPGREDLRVRVCLGFVGAAQSGSDELRPREVAGEGGVVHRSCKRAGCNCDRYRDPRHI